MKEPFDKLWSNAVHFHQQHEKWMSGPLLQVNAEEVEEEVGSDYHLFHEYYHFVRGLLMG